MISSPRGGSSGSSPALSGAAAVAEATWRASLGVSPRPRASQPNGENAIPGVPPSALSSLGPGGGFTISGRCAASSSPPPLPRSLPRIAVVVRKRPLSEVEKRRNEADLVQTKGGNSVVVDEPREKVDLTPYVMRHEFRVDYAFDEESSNAEIYRDVVHPLVEACCLRQASTSCFAYGQTGSGKTYTMLGPQPYGRGAEAGVFELAATDIFRFLEGTDKQAFVSFFEIYNGKLFDLLQNRVAKCNVACCLFEMMFRKLVAALENGRKEVIVRDLRLEQVATKERLVAAMIEGVELRKIGVNSVNDESSRSHAILQVLLRKTGSEEACGRIAFIDLAGSERGADTLQHGRQTQQDGAGINRSLLALKECIRAMDQDKGHIPFRDSELTKVLREIFVGRGSRSVMIATISPSTSCCEQTLNTLRYASRVKNFRQPGSVPIACPSSSSATSTLGGGPRPSSSSADCGGGSNSNAGGVTASHHHPYPRQIVSATPAMRHSRLSHVSVSSLSPGGVDDEEMISGEGKNTSGSSKEELLSSSFPPHPKTTNTTGNNSAGLRGSLSLSDSREEEEGGSVGFSPSLDSPHSAMRRNRNSAVPTGDRGGGGRKVTCQGASDNGEARYDEVLSKQDVDMVGSKQSPDMARLVTNGSTTTAGSAGGYTSTTTAAPPSLSARTSSTATNNNNNRYATSSAYVRRSGQPSITPTAEPLKRTGSSKHQNSAGTSGSGTGAGGGTSRITSSSNNSTATSDCMNPGVTGPRLGRGVSSRSSLSLHKGRGGGGTHRDATPGQMLSYSCYPSVAKLEDISLPDRPASSSSTVSGGAGGAAKDKAAARRSCEMSPRENNINGTVRKPRPSRSASPPSRELCGRASPPLLHSDDHSSEAEIYSNKVPASKCPGTGKHGSSSCASPLIGASQARISTGNGYPFLRKNSRATISSHALTCGPSTRWSPFRAAAGGGGGALGGGDKNAATAGILSSSTRDESQGHIGQEVPLGDGSFPGGVHRPLANYQQHHEFNLRSSICSVPPTVEGENSGAMMKITDLQQTEGINHSPPCDGDRDPSKPSASSRTAGSSSSRRPEQSFWSERDGHLKKSMLKQCLLLSGSNSNEATAASVAAAATAAAAAAAAVAATEGGTGCKARGKGGEAFEISLNGLQGPPAGFSPTKQGGFGGSKEEGGPGTRRSDPDHNANHTGLPLRGGRIRSSRTTASASARRYGAKAPAGGSSGERDGEDPTAGNTDEGGGGFLSPEKGRAASAGGSCIATRARGSPPHYSKQTSQHEKDGEGTRLSSLNSLGQTVAGSGRYLQGRGGGENSLEDDEGGGGRKREASGSHSGTLKKNTEAMNLRQTWLKNQHQQQSRADAMICPDGSSIIFLNKRPAHQREGAASSGEVDGVEKGGRSSGSVREGRPSSTSGTADGFMSFEDPGLLIDAEMTDAASFCSSTKNTMKNPSRFSKRQQADVNQEDADMMESGGGGGGNGSGPEKRLSLTNSAGSSRCSSSSPLKKKPGTSVVRESHDYSSNHMSSSNSNGYARASPNSRPSIDEVQGGGRLECLESKELLASSKTDTGFPTEDDSSDRLTGGGLRGRNVASHMKDGGEGRMSLTHSTSGSTTIPGGMGLTMKPRTTTASMNEDRENGGQPRRRSFSSSCMSKANLSLDANSQRLLAQLLPKSGSISRSYHGSAVSSSGGSTSISSSYLPEKSIPERRQAATEKTFHPDTGSQQQFQSRLESDSEAGDKSPGGLLSSRGSICPPRDQGPGEKGWWDGGGAVSGYREPQTVLREEFGCDTLYHELELEQLDALQSAVRGRRVARMEQLLQLAKKRAEDAASRHGVNQNQQDLLVCRLHQRNPGSHEFGEYVRQRMEADFRKLLAMRQVWVEAEELRLLHRLLSTEYQTKSARPSEREREGGGRYSSRLSSKNSSPSNQDRLQQPPRFQFLSNSNIEDEPAPPSPADKKKPAELGDVEMDEAFASPPTQEDEASLPVASTGSPTKGGALLSSRAYRASDTCDFLDC